MKSTLLPLLSLWFTACAAPAATTASTTAPPDAGTPDVAAEVAASEDVAIADVANDRAPDVVKSWPKGLHGKKPDAPVALPAFSQVVDSSGASVSPDDLKGHWSVLWFYPMASTGG